MVQYKFKAIYNHKPNASGDFLIGQGFLSRGGSVLICGEPGCGKSKFAQHIGWSLVLGRSFLGLKPSGPLKVLYIQTEDTVDDIHESMVGYAGQHGLSAADQDRLDRNWICVNAAGYTRGEFLDGLEAQMEAHRPDVIIADPLLAFIGCDLTNQAGMTEFLRVGLAPMLEGKRCGLICVHHSAKAAAGKYTGSKVAKALGSIEIAAFFRGIIDLERKPGDPDTLLMEIVKRAKQAQLLSADGRLLRKLTVHTGTDSIAWTREESALETAPPPPRPKKSVGSPPKAAKADVEEFVKKQRATGKADAVIIKAVAKEFGYSAKHAGRFVK